MRTADQLVNAEVIQNVSHLVAILANGTAVSDLGDLTEQAFELAMPVYDFESAAIENGWANADSDTAQEFCEAENIEPDQREIFEHWIVTPWLAEKLIAKGEQVDTDFAGFNVWGRTTTGQAIAIDSVIEAIVAELNAKYGS